MNFFKGDPWLNIIYLLLALIGIILAVIFYYKGKKEKKPLFNRQTLLLIDEKLATLKNIEIKYKNSVLTNLALTRFAIFNSGKDPIRESDIASMNPINIYGRTEDIIIYDYEIAYQNAVNNIQIDLIGNKILKISFEYLDFNEGFILNIYHNGKFANDLMLRGTLMGAKLTNLSNKENYFGSKIDGFLNPFNYLFNKKGWIFKVFGGILFLVYGIPILLPIMLISLALDFINDKVINKTPKQFYLGGMFE